MSETFNAIYADGHFEKISLNEQIHKGGAAGKIYTITNHEKLVAKIFHSSKNSSTNRQKLGAMLLNRPAFPPVVKDDVEYVQIAWIEAILEDDKGFCIGYLMPLIHMDEAVSLDHLMQKAVRKKLNLPEKYAYRIFAAYNVASMVSALHKCGHYIVDLKPSNVYVYKENMMVAMLDCDGFSIKGEKERYPAEFVSEEYIYPEGMEMSCDEMGEEQDKFALAVIIFKLLNNGIHPFSGVPRKADGEMLTIQQRIEKYHYAYGLWPDTYQAPHPYSMMDYFDKKTMGLFERAFVKGQIRPTAKEWQEHLWELLKGLKTCKSNPNHVYFTSKGCGLCIVEDKFFNKMRGVKEQVQAPQTVRGLEVSALSQESINKTRQEKAIENNKLKNISLGIMAAYMLFFTLLPLFAEMMDESIAKLGLGLQAVLVTLIMLGVNKLIHAYSDVFVLLQNKSITQMLQVYALICMIIAIVSTNNIPLDIFKLAH